MTGGGYDLQGTMLEACSCGVLCPCWIGEDPDQGSCDAFNAYHFDRGTIGGVDVSGLSFVQVAHIPGNVLAGNWQRVVFVADLPRNAMGKVQKNVLRETFAKLYAER